MEEEYVFHCLRDCWFSCNIWDAFGFIQCVGIFSIMMFGNGFVDLQIPRLLYRDRFQVFFPLHYVVVLEVQK